MEEHLLHPHAWVRLVAAQLLGFLFTCSDPDEIADCVKEGAGKKIKRKGMANGSSPKEDYWAGNAQNRVREDLWDVT